MDTTVNRGYQMPKSDGTDIMSPDLWRLADVAIDLDMAKALQYKAGETSAFVGTNAAIGTTKTNYRFSSVCVVEAGGLGLFTIPWPAAFANGITYVGLTAGDNASGLTQVVVNATVCTLANLKGKAYRADGTPVPSGSSIRVNVEVVGW